MRKAEYLGRMKSNIPKIYWFAFFSSFLLVSSVLIPFFTEWGKISFTQVMILQSWYLLWVFLLEIPTGAIADFLGKRLSIILGSLAYIFGIIAYSVYPDFSLFLVAEFLWALSTALISGADSALLYDTLEVIGSSKESKKIFAKESVFNLSGILVSSVLGGIIASWIGLQQVMLLGLVPAVVSLIIALRLKEPKTIVKQENESYKGTIKDGVSYFFRTKVLKILAFDYIVISVAAYMLYWLIQPMLIVSRVNIAYFGVVIGLYMVFEIFITSNIRMFERLFNSKRFLLLFTAGIMGIALIIGGLSKSVPLTIIVIVLGAGFGFSRNVLFINYLNKHIPSGRRATILSAISMLRSLPIIVFNPFMGLLAEWSLSFTLIALGVITIMFAIISDIREEDLID